MTEVWRLLPGWDGRYEVSSRGRVRSLYVRGKHKRKKPLIMRFGRHLYGYPTVCLTKPGAVVRPHPLHRLMLETFVGSCPAGMHGCHRNGNPLDNRLKNLRWGTPLSNQRDRIRHGTHNRGGHNSECKLNDLIVRIIKHLKGRLTSVEVGGIFGVSRTAVYFIWSGKTWKHI